MSIAVAPVHHRTIEIDGNEIYGDFLGRFAAAPSTRG
jgi:hypothetical protein